MENSKNIILVCVIVLIVVIVGVSYYFIHPNQEASYSNKGSSTNSGAIQQPVYGVAEEKDYGNLENVFSENDLVKELPEDSAILISFYNFNSGEREFEKSYIVTKGSIKEGTTNDYDVKLIMHSKYITAINENNLCNIVKDAINNGDLVSETGLSKLEIAWKFKSVMEYRDCLGL